MRYKVGETLFTATLIPEIGRYAPRKCKIVRSEIDPTINCRVYTIILGCGKEKTWRYEEELFKNFDNAMKDCDVKNLAIFGSISDYEDM